MIPITGSFVFANSVESAFFKPLSIRETLAVGMAIMTPWHVTFQ